MTFASLSHPVPIENFWVRRNKGRFWFNERSSGGMCLRHAFCFTEKIWFVCRIPIKKK